MLFRRLVRRGDGGVRVTLPPVERALLLDVARTLRAVIADVDADTPHDEVVGRLFPRAYDDPLEQMEYADHTMGALAESKRTMLDDFEASLRGGEAGESRWRTELDPDGVAAWMAVLQDGRLVLSRALGIETEADWEAMDPEEDDVAAVLDYLGAMLDGLVGIAMGRL